MARSKTSDVPPGGGEADPKLKSPEAAAYLGVTERWLRDAKDRGDIPHLKMGKTVRYLKSDLDAYIAKSRRFGRVA